MVLDLINKIFREETTSKERAIERLRLVLVHDRANVAPGLMETLKEELIEVISKYMDIDEESMEVSLNSNERSASLVANIPVKRIRR
ncbi:MAG: cell division topological specificity factor MinE [Firmicutes bacterium]|nr:cell division topological specificity factor MinE [Bacillota bacterium]